MRRGRTVLQLLIVAGVACASTGCTVGEELWFRGGFDEALVEADARQTLLMIDFKTSWCSWCKRLDEDTLSDAEVQQELKNLVVMKLDAEKEGEATADRFAVQSYPTIVFVDPTGREIDRILGYLPPDAFIAEVQRIRKGDTFAACLAKLDEDPGNLEELRRAVAGFLERDDSFAAVKKIEAFHHAHGGGIAHHECAMLMFKARSALQEEIYVPVIEQYRLDWVKVPTVPDTVGVEALHQLVSRLDEVEDDRAALRQARMDDARDLIDELDIENLRGETLLEVAKFAYESGLFEMATQMYRRWFAEREEGESTRFLNEVAWNLYLIGEEQDLAIALAREAYSIEQDPGIGDTLARLLYRSGNREEAIMIQSKAAGESQGRMAQEFSAAMEKMRNGDELDDSPPFERFPGDKIT